MPPPSSLIDLLFAEPYRFDFFQAVRLLERLAGTTGAIGRDDPRREAVRFSVHQSLAFPAAAIYDLRRSPDGGGPSSTGRAEVPRAVMTVAFFGLTGPSGILPTIYTTHLRRCLREGDRLTPDFFDLFNHRLISLFYRAGEKYRVARDEEAPHRGAFADALLALIGLGSAGGGPVGALRDRLALDDRRLLLHAGLFSRQIPTVEGLATLLVETLGMPVEVEQFVPRWVEIGPEFRTRLGETNNELGPGMVIGRRVLDSQGKFRLRVGPLTFEAFRRLLPGTEGLRELAELTRLYVGPEFVFDVELILRAEEIPLARLSAGPGGSALGRYSWARSGPPGEDASVVFAVGEWSRFR